MTEYALSIWGIPLGKLSRTDTKAADAKKTVDDFMDDYAPNLMTGRNELDVVMELFWFIQKRKQAKLRNNEFAETFMNEAAVYDDFRHCHMKVMDAIQGYTLPQQKKPSEQPEQSDQTLSEHTHE